MKSLNIIRADNGWLVTFSDGQTIVYEDTRHDFEILHLEVQTDLRRMNLRGDDERRGEGK